MNRRVEPLGFFRAPFVAERHETRAERAVAWRFGCNGRSRGRHRAGSVFLEIIVRGARALRHSRALQELRMGSRTAIALAATRLAVIARGTRRALARITSDLVL